MSRHYQLIRRDGTVYTSSQREKVEDRIRADWPEASPRSLVPKEGIREYTAPIQPTD